MKKGQAHKHRTQNTLLSSKQCLLCVRTLASLCIRQWEGKSASLCGTFLYGSNFRLQSGDTSICQVLHTVASVHRTVMLPISVSLILWLRSYHSFGCKTWVLDVAINSTSHSVLHPVFTCSLWTFLLSTLTWRWEVLC